MLALGALVLFLFRPVAMLPPSGSRDAVVPVLVDVSRSMRLADADGQPRLARAIALLKTDLLPALSSRFVTELYGVGDGLAPVQIDRLAADARRTDLAGALAAVRERYRGQRVAGIVVLSDGGDTGSGGAGRAGGQGLKAARPCSRSASARRTGRAIAKCSASSPAIHGSTSRPSTSMSAPSAPGSDGRRSRFACSATASCSTRGASCRRLMDRRSTSVFTVSPDPSSATVYTAEIPADESEPVVENNARSVLVSPAGRKRRLLVIEGAPGFEHSFMTRAWAADTGLEVDSVTRKGKNAEGQDTFLVQAAADARPR